MNKQKMSHLAGVVLGVALSAWDFTRGNYVFGVILAGLALYSVAQLLAKPVNE